MTLLTRIQALQSQLDSIGTLQERVAEAGRLNERANELTAVQGQLRAAAAALRLLRSGGVPLPHPPTSLAQAGRHLGAVRTRFTANRAADSLTRGQDWSALLARTKEGAPQAADALNRAWRTYVEGLFSGERPEIVSSQLAQTDGNKAALICYQAAWTRWRACATAPPSSRAELQVAAEAAAALRRIDATFDRDVPPAVKLFLDAVGQGGAGLDLLTEEVRDWLRGTGSHGRYRVVAARA